MEAIQVSDLVGTPTKEEMAKMPPYMRLALIQKGSILYPNSFKASLRYYRAPRRINIG